jgi:hypothetical protein
MQPDLLPLIAKPIAAARRLSHDPTIGTGPKEANKSTPSGFMQGSECRQKAIGRPQFFSLQDVCSFA